MCGDEACGWGMTDDDGMSSDQISIHTHTQATYLCLGPRVVAEITEAQEGAGGGGLGAKGRTAGVPGHRC